MIQSVVKFGFILLTTPSLRSLALTDLLKLHCILGLKMVFNNTSFCFIGCKVSPKFHQMSDKYSLQSS